MMIELQKLIDKLKVEQEKVISQYPKSSNIVVSDLGSFYQGEYWTFSCIIQKLTLLLSDKHTEAITEEAHSANTMLGEVCPCCKRPTSEPYRASSSETGDVRQNLDKLKPEE